LVDEPVACEEVEKLPNDEDAVAVVVLGRLSLPAAPLLD
jgi:hypothetical protein